jgi:hypothetical protein
MRAVRIWPNVKSNAVVSLVALAGGFLGSWLFAAIGPRPATVRAGRFEVVDPSGRTTSYWGLDPNVHLQSSTPKGTLLVFLDSNGRHRCQIGSNSGDYSPQLEFYGTAGPMDDPEHYDVQPRFSVALGDTGSPFLLMRGRDGDKVLLGAVYGDVGGEPELGWGLSFRAWKVPAAAGIGYSRWRGGYVSGVSAEDGAGKKWSAQAGEFTLMPLQRRPDR